MTTVAKSKNYTSPETKTRQLAGLKQAWQPGESGNPAGRPPIGNLCRPIVTIALRKLLREAQEGKLIGAEVLAKAWYEEAKKSPYYFALMLERVEGKVPQAIIGGEVQVDNSRHVSITILGNEALRDSAISLQRALEVQGVVMEDTDLEPPAASERLSLAPQGHADGQVAAPQAGVVESVDLGAQRGTGGHCRATQLGRVPVTRTVTRTVTETVADPESLAEALDADAETVAVEVDQGHDQGQPDAEPGPEEHTAALRRVHHAAHRRGGAQARTVEVKTQPPLTM